MDKILSFDQLVERLLPVAGPGLARFDLERSLELPFFDQTEIVPGRLWGRQLYWPGCENQKARFEFTLNKDGERISARACDCADDGDRSVTVRRALTALVYLAEHPQKGYIEITSSPFSVNIYGNPDLYKLCPE